MNSMLSANSLHGVVTYSLTVRVVVYEYPTVRVVVCPMIAARGFQFMSKLYLCRSLF